MTKEEAKTFLLQLHTDKQLNKSEHEALRIAIEALEQEPETEWIPVSKNPKEMGCYMTTLDYGEYGLVAGQRRYHGEDIGWSDECVIAWMPLPEPYKAESEAIDANSN